MKTIIPSQSLRTYKPFERLLITCVGSLLGLERCINMVRFVTADSADGHDLSHAVGHAPETRAVVARSNAGVRGLHTVGFSVAAQRLGHCQEKKSKVCNSERPHRAGMARNLASSPATRKQQGMQKQEMQVQERGG